MNTTQATTPALVSTGARLATAVAVVAVVSAAWLAAVHQSRAAVETAARAMSPTLYVTLPTVEIVGQRTAAGSTEVAGTIAPAL